MDACKRFVVVVVVAVFAVNSPDFETSIVRRTTTLSKCFDMRNIISGNECIKKKTIKVSESLTKMKTWKFVNNYVCLANILRHSVFFVSYCAQLRVGLFIQQLSIKTGYYRIKSKYQFCQLDSVFIYYIINYRVDPSSKTFASNPHIIHQNGWKKMSNIHYTYMF